MTHRAQEGERLPGQQKLLRTLERLLAINATEVGSAVEQAAALILEAMGADIVEGFIYDPEADTLVSAGTSTTPMAKQQKALGFDRLPLSRGGRIVGVYRTGIPYMHGHIDIDPEVLPGAHQDLGIRSMLVVPLELEGVRRGVIAVCSVRPERFADDDLVFLQAAAHWAGFVVQRAKLMERITQNAAREAQRLTAEELVTVLAHDLNNYLSPLKVRLALIRRRAQRDDLPTYVREAEEADRSVDRLHGMINDLLDMARLEHGIFALSKEPVDLAELARETADALRTSEFEIAVHLPAKLCIDADPERLRQVLENLLTNARKHSRDGVPAVVEVVEEKREDGDWAIVTVRDEGPGIDPALLPHLFTRFARKSRSEGLGLGLYIAHGIAEAHGGTLTVDSAPGAGTTFSLALPLPPEPKTTC